MHDHTHHHHAPAEPGYPEHPEHESESRHDHAAMGHGDHDAHEGHNIEMFRSRFWLSLLVTFDVVFVTLALWTFEPVMTD